MTAMLMREGFECLPMRSGAAAWERLQRRQVDLIVMEIELTGFDGLDLVENVRKTAETRRIPVIILTNSRDKTRMLRAVTLGIQGYFLKSQLTEERLLSRIENLIGKTSANEAGTGRPISRGSKNAGGNANRGQGASVTSGTHTTTAQAASPAPVSPRSYSTIISCETHDQEIPQLLTREPTRRQFDEETEARVGTVPIAVAELARACEPAGREDRGEGSAKNRTFAKRPN
jgi:DNA-binding response OmpR family regulator